MDSDDKVLLPLGICNSQANNNMAVEAGNRNGRDA